MRIAKGAKDCSREGDAQSSADRRTGRTPDDNRRVAHCRMRAHKRTRETAHKSVDGRPSTGEELLSWRSALSGAAWRDAVSQMPFRRLVFDVVAAGRNWTWGLGKRSRGVE